MRRAAVFLVPLVAAACTTGASRPIGGEPHWIDVGEGRVKAQVFSKSAAGARPVLIVVLHGDIPDPRPDYQYLFAAVLTQPLSETPDPSGALRAALGKNWPNERIVAAGILRPGYTDPSGDSSSGDMGMATGDNYTPAAVDAVAAAVRRLKFDYDASAVVIVGHSGGGTIAANILGRHPDLAQGALLVACGCDPEAWRARMRVQRPGPAWSQPNPSLLPLSLAGGVAPAARVRLLVGDQDNVTVPADSRRYAEALERRGVGVHLTVVPGLGHNILMTREAFRELAALVGGLDM